MGIVRLDKDGNLTGNAVAGNRPGDVAARNSRQGEYGTPVTSTAPKLPVTVTTDGSHVAMSVGEGKPEHYENRKPAPATAKPRVTSREMIGGQYAESEIAGRADLNRVLPPEQMDALRSMARNGQAIIIEHAESPAAPASTPRGIAGATTRHK